MITIRGVGVGTKVGRENAINRERDRDMERGVRVFDIDMMKCCPAHFTGEKLIRCSFRSYLSVINIFTCIISILDLKDILEEIRSSCDLNGI